MDISPCYRYRARERLQSQQIQAMDRLMEQLGDSATSPAKINELAAEYTQRTQDLEANWASELAKLKDMQRKEYHGYLEAM